MASIRKEITVRAGIEQAWDAMRDIGALHTRLIPGFVIDTQLEGYERIVTFANGRQVRECIVTIDDDMRRLVWSANGDLLTHHNGTAQIEEDSEGRTRVVGRPTSCPASQERTGQQRKGRTAPQSRREEA